MAIRKKGTQRPVVPYRTRVAVKAGLLDNPAGCFLLLLYDKSDLADIDQAINGKWAFCGILQVVPDNEFDHVMV